MTTEFDRATAIRSTGGGRYQAETSADWLVGRAPNGGYLLATMVAAASAELSHPDPLTVTAHYLARTDLGSFDVEVDTIREGRNFSTAAISLVQEGRERIRALSTHGDLGRADGPTLDRMPMPEEPAPDACVRIEPNPAMPIRRRFDWRITPETAGGLTDEPTGIPEIRGWIRFADGREPDIRSLALFADAYLPALLNLGRFGWLPTLELTVHFRAHPAPGWLFGQIHTTVLRDGLFEESGAFWDSEGTLVAMSRQLAVVLNG